MTYISHIHDWSIGCGVSEFIFTKFWEYLKSNITKKRLCHTFLFFTYIRKCIFWILEL